MGDFMKKNILYSALLNVLLLVPSQVFCAEQPSISSKDILGRMWFSMPTAPEWMTNFTTNVASGFSNLSDRTKYLIYGAAAAFLGYIGWRKVIKPVSQSLGGFYLDSINLPDERMWPSNLKELNSLDNYNNIATILNEHIGAPLRHERAEQVFMERVCPVLTKFAGDLDDQNKWNIFLDNIIEKNSTRTLLEGKNRYGLSMFQLMKYTCPNVTTMTPLKKLLIERNPNDTDLLRILNQ